MPLTLDQLDHINDCEDGIGCVICHERYPLHLIDSHVDMCTKKSSIKPAPKKKMQKKEMSFAEARQGMSEALRESREMQEMERMNKRNSQKESRVRHHKNCPKNKNNKSKK